MCNRRWRLEEKWYLYRNIEVQGHEGVVEKMDKIVKEANDLLRNRQKEKNRWKDEECGDEFKK